MTGKVNFTDLCVDGVTSLRPYEPGKPVTELERELGITDIIKLASNENPLGPSPEVLRAVSKAVPDVALYPDGNGFELKRALSAYHSIAMDCITLGSGSDHIIELLARVFLCPGRSAVMSRHAFAVYFIVSQAAGASLRVADPNPVEHVMPYGHNLDAMLAQIDKTTRVVFIANPNNPTGTWVDTREFTAFLDRIPQDVVVLVDEAYFDYVQEPGYSDSRKLMDRYPNLVVLRTFSKAYGLAGLRVGYALANPEITDLLNRVRLAFNPSSLAQVAATVALADREHLRRTVELNKTELLRVQHGVAELGLKAIPSVCNFITVDVERFGSEVFGALLKKGIIVRPLDNYGLPRHLRISIGLPGQNDRMLAALASVLER